MVLTDTSKTIKAFYNEIDNHLLKSGIPTDIKSNNIFKEIKPFIWNHHQSDIRTNNNVEGFNSTYNRHVRTVHPNIFLLINFLKEQQAYALIDYERIKQSQAVRPVSKIQVEIQLTLELKKVQHRGSKLENIYFEDDLFPLIDQQETLNLQPVYPHHLNQIAEVYSSIEQIQTVFDEPPYQIEIIEREETYELDEEVEINEIAVVGEPVQIAELEQPVQIAELEKPVQMAELEQPVQQVEIFQIVQTQQPEITFKTLTFVPTVSRLPRLAEILKYIGLNNLDDEEVDYIGMISNKQALTKINSERELIKKERAQIEKLIEYRISPINEKQIVEEVHKIWETSGLSKRIRNSQCDKKKRLKISKKE
ncbi:unnamed protein product [Brachionus calyciflorus]|uniref:Uncharacterized protein n=1 Tax=Brachionus calyciflorus TaxID=104777 RepID=A0A814GL54_9BILA|nr:unnamed protein product [Brachionus calyciflorus]